MIYLDYLLLSLKTDTEVPVGPSEICNFISAEYNRRFPKRARENNLVNGDEHSTLLPVTPSKEEEFFRNLAALEQGRKEISTEPAGSVEWTKPPAYFYPRVQYKVIRGGPIVAAVNEGCELLWELYDQIDILNAAEPDWKITEKRLIEKKTPMGLTRDYIKYRFLTPWLGLPEEAFKKYLLMDEETRQKMLVKVLDGHIRSIAESMGCPPNGELKIKMNIKSNYIFQRDIHVAGLFGSFVTNFEIPSFLGIGKSVSRGFGTIKQA